MKIKHKPIKAKKVWVLMAHCGAILDIVEDRIQYHNKMEIPIPSDAAWYQMKTEEYDGCFVIQEPL